jgi:D-alanyl-D-alanine-carboxypeptidase/D-alanyl-D-alanine-endopeptidase
MRYVLAALFLACSGMAQGPGLDPARGLEVAWTVPIGSNSFGGGAVADVDGDGRLEVAFASYFFDGRVRVLNGEDGSELWSWRSRPERPQGDCLDASLKFADLDGDGRLELVVPVSSGCCVHVFDAKTGEKRWTYETGPGDCIDSPPAIVDVDGDGAPELVFGSFRDRVHVVDGKTGKRERLIEGWGGFVQTGVIVTDLDGDGVVDFVAGSFRGKQGNRVTAKCGKTGKELWRYGIGESPRGGPSLGIYHGASFGDLDGDGEVELVVSAYDGKVVALDGKTGAVEWSVSPGDRYFMGPVAIADLDDDAKPEVVACGQRLTVMSGAGKLRYSRPLVGRASFGGAHRGASIADLDGDGKLDIAYLLDNGAFGVRRGFDGRLLYSLPARLAFDGRVMSNNHGPLLADLSGDGQLDAFYVIGHGSSRQAGGGVAVCVTGFAGKGPGWPMLRHDLRNSGNFLSDARSTAPLVLEAKASTRAAIGPELSPGKASSATVAEDAPSTVWSHVDPLVQPLLDEGRALGLTVGLLRGGDAEFRGYGRVRPGFDAKPSKETVYEIGSITKVFTGILLADATLRGLARLEDPVGRHLPEEPRLERFRGQSIRLVQLATHRSGLPLMPLNFSPKDGKNPYIDYRQEELYEALSVMRLGRSPGRRYAYSNLGAGLLGHLMVRANGASSWEMLAKERILTPLGMASTHVILPERLEGQMSAPSNAKGQITHVWDFDVLVGAGGLRSTATDMLRFAKACLRPGALAAEHPRLAAALWLAGQRHDGVDPGSTKRTQHMGLGWHYAGPHVIWHNGGTGGFRSHLRLDRKAGLAVLILASTTSSEIDGLAVRISQLLAP